MKKAIVIYCFILAFAKVNGQGCSDPGLCTIGTLNSGVTNDTVSSINFVEADIDELLNSEIVAEKYKIGIEGVQGIAEKDVVVYSIVLRSSIRISEKLLANIKIPYTFTQGGLGTANGTGDITVSMQNTFKSGNNIRLAYTLGAVIPTNNSNMKANGFVLPMAYQTSLGVFSVLGGLSFAYKGWGAAIGYQQNFGSNGNEFTTESLEENENLPNYDPLNPERFTYQSSRHLTRKSDVVLRLEKRIKLGNFNILAGALPIYRLGNSTREMLDGNREEIAQTKGLTFNLTAGVNYSIKKNWRIITNLGFPIIQRAAVADGLVRSRVLIVGVTYRGW